MNQFIIIALVLCILQSFLNSIVQFTVKDDEQKNIFGIIGSIISSIVSILCIIGILSSN